MTPPQLHRPWRGRGLRVSLLASGSAANATLVEHGDTAVLIDAGVQWRHLVARLTHLGRPPESLSAVVITHHHTDHVAALASLLRAQPQLPVFMTGGTAVALHNPRLGTPADVGATAEDRSSADTPPAGALEAAVRDPLDEVPGLQDAAAQGLPEETTVPETDPFSGPATLPSTRRALVRRLAVADVRLIEPGAVWTVGALQLRTTRLPHDAPDTIGVRCEVVGCPALAMAQVTDLGSITGDVVDLVRHVGLLVVETNHDPDMLRRAHYPRPLKERIRSDTGHLANAQGAALAALVAHPGLAWVIGAHLSSDSNTAALASQHLHQSLAGTSFRGRIRTAWPDRVSGPWLLAAPDTIPPHWTPQE